MLRCFFRDEDAGRERVRKVQALRRGLRELEDDREGALAEARDDLGVLDRLVRLAPGDERPHRLGVARQRELLVGERRGLLEHGCERLFAPGLVLEERVGERDADVDVLAFRPPAFQRLAALPHAQRGCSRTMCLRRSIASTRGGLRVMT